MPRRSTGGMRQWNKIERAAFLADGEAAADDFIELLEGKELRDSQFANGNDEGGSEEVDFVVHPGGAVSDFVRSWDAVAACRRFSRETTTDRGEVNLSANLFFSHAAEL